MYKQKIIDAFLSPYNEYSQFLKSFNLEKDKGFATFVTNSNFYCIDQQPVHHFTAVELQVCLNQLLYIYIAHLGLIGHTGEKEEFISNINENNFITEQNVHYKKEIDASTAIQAEIELTINKKIRDTRFIECKFNFESACFGTVKLIMKNCK